MKFKKYLPIILFFIPLLSSAVGISIEPSKINLNYPSQKNISLKLKNISNEVISISIYADEFKNNIKIYPTDFEISPNEISNVNLKFNFKETNKILNTNISVIARSLDKKAFNASTGIKIPLSVNFNKFNYGVYFLPIILFIILLGIIFILYSKLHNKKFANKFKRLSKKIKNAENNLLDKFR